MLLISLKYEDCYHLSIQVLESALTLTNSFIEYKHLNSDSILKIEIAIYFTILNCSLKMASKYLWGYHLFFVDGT